MFRDSKWVSDTGLVPWNDKLVRDMELVSRHRKCVNDKRHMPRNSKLVRHSKWVSDTELVPRNSKLVSDMNYSVKAQYMGQ